MHERAINPDEARGERGLGEEDTEAVCRAWGGGEGGEAGAEELMYGPVGFLAGFCAVCGAFACATEIGGGARAHGALLERVGHLVYCGCVVGIWDGEVEKV